MSEAKNLIEMEQVFQADLTWVDGAFQPSVQVRVGPDGRIADVGPLGLYPTVRLPHRALLPGFVSAHSHAFQRGLRGRVETFPSGPGSFWTWRDAMYKLAQQLDASSFRTLNARAFREMRAAGITAVGEFHYLHHASAGADYAFDELVFEAAERAGIRLVLLESYYRIGGIGRPLEGAQRRFRSPSPDRFWKQVEKLIELANPTLQSVGIAVHSVRAAGPEELAAVHGEARYRSLPFYMHLEEHRREIEECRASYGRGPLELVLETIEVDEGFTAVHCTHSEPKLLGALFAAGGNVCLCPLTEANLGDGLPRLPDPAPHGRLCLGTDSNACIAMIEEMRWLEYGQRLSREQRGALRGRAGDVASFLLEAATTNGAHALALSAGAIAPGLWADFVAIDLDAPALAGWEPETLLASLIFGAGEEAIAATCVGGRWLEHRAAR